MHEYLVDDVIYIPRGAELNHGPSEDSDSFTLIREEEAIVRTPLTNGAIEVFLPSHPEFESVFFHQPEPKANLQLLG